MVSFELEILQYIQQCQTLNILNNFSNEIKIQLHLLHKYPQYLCRQLKILS